MRKQNRLIKLLFLLNGLTFILATMCPFTGLAPNTKISSPEVIMPSEISGWPSTTNVISIAGTIEFDDDCSTGEIFPLFSLTIKPSGTETEIVHYELDCDTRKITGDGEWSSSSQPSDPMFATSTLGPISFMVTISLDEKRWKGEIQTGESQKMFSRSGTTASLSFDGNTKLRPCAGKAAANAKPCTVHNLYFFDEYFVAAYPAGFASMGTATTSSFFPLLNGEIADSYGSSTGYLGDKASSPSAGTSPKWDSSNEYIEITDKAQFLSFSAPPSLQPTVATTTNTISISAWVKISSIPVTTATIFALTKSDGTELLLKLQIDQSGLVTLIAGTSTLGGLTVSLNTWHLVGFTGSIRTNLKGLTGTIFVDSTSTEVYTNPFSMTTEIDLSDAALVRIGGPGTSFIGNVFGLRIATPGGGFIPPSACSADSSIELGLGGTFPLGCATGKKLYPKENKCYDTCPTGTEETTNTPLALCMPPISNSGSGSGSSSSSDKKGLSVGLVVAIVLSSTAVLILVLLSVRHAYKDDKCWVALTASLKRKRKDQEKIYMQAAASSPVSPIASEGPLATEEALASEAP